MSTNKEIARAYVHLVSRLDYLVSQLEYLGENEMGLLHEHLAGRFHDATDSLRDLAHELKQDALWPHEAS